MSDFHTLSISEIKKITPNAVSVTFSIPENLKETFRFKAGQYITLKHIHNGNEIRRAYSIYSSPKSGSLSVGIKQVKGGTFSVYANTKLKQGDTIDVMPPEGKFTLDAAAENSNNYLAFAAGSGITPVLSIITSALEENPDSSFSLVYGNRTLEETMFTSELLKLKETYPSRFSPEFIFSRKIEDSGLFGRIEPSTINYLLKNKFAGRNFDAYYLCGPEGMIETMSELLQVKNIDKNNIFFELFTPTDEVSLEESHDGTTEVTVVLDDETETFTMPQNSSVLEAVLKHGLDAPFSCQGGICSTCIARIVKGKAEMRKNQILTDEEIAEGFILTCQAHPSTATLHIDYDDV